MNLPTLTKIEFTYWVERSFASGWAGCWSCRNVVAKDEPAAVIELAQGFYLCGACFKRITRTNLPKPSVKVRLAPVWENEL